MPARDRAAATKFQYLEHSGLTFTDAVGAQRNDRVRNSEGVGGTSAVSAPAYSPTQNDVIGMADRRPAASWRESGEMSHHRLRTPGGP